MCILLYVKLLWCSSIPYIYGQLEERGVHHSLGIYAFGNISNIFGVVVFQTYLVNQRAISAIKYMCILLYKLNLFSELVFHRSMVNLRRRALVYVHSAICETSLM